VYDVVEGGRAWGVVVMFVGVRERSLEGLIDFSR